MGFNVKGMDGSTGLGQDVAESARAAFKAEPVTTQTGTSTPTPELAKDSFTRAQARDAFSLPGVSSSSGLRAPAPVVDAGVRPERITIHDLPQIHAGPALEAAFAAIKAPEGPVKVSRLDENPSAFAARWRTVESAQDKIGMTYFIYEADVFGMALTGHLFKKAREGKKVRLMVDETGAFKSELLSTRRDCLEALVDTGNAEVRIYGSKYKTLLKAELDSAEGIACTHAKIVTVDDQRAITGGRNISKDYFASRTDHPGGFRDCDVQVEGPTAAQSLDAALNAEFDNEAITHKIDGDWCGDWVRRDVELLGAYVMMDLWLKRRPLDKAEAKQLRGDPIKQARAATALLKEAAVKLPELGIDEHRVHKLLQEIERCEQDIGKANGLGSSLDSMRFTSAGQDFQRLLKEACELVKYPDLCGTYREDPQSFDANCKVVKKVSVVGEGEDTLNDAVLKLIHAADHRIVIENPYVCLTEPVLQAMKAASAKGVDIWLCTNSPESTDSAATQAIFLRDWPNLLAAIPTMRIFALTGEQKLHAKTFEVDDTVTLVSTYNLDIISAEVNSEDAAIFWSEDFARDTLKSYLDDYNDPSLGVVEYQIEKDAKGRPILDDSGQPKVLFGPDDHISGKNKLVYGILQPVFDAVRHIPVARSLKHNWNHTRP